MFVADLEAVVQSKRAPSGLLCKGENYMADQIFPDFAMWLWPHRLMAVCRRPVPT